MNKVLKVITVCLLLLTMTGCSKTSKSDDTVIIKYANWNNGADAEQNLEQLMIAEYEKTHKNIDIQVEPLDGDWNEALGTMASAGKLPDVFMQKDIPTGLANDWLLDITKYAEIDNDFIYIASTVKENTKVNEKVFGIPFAQFLMGYYVNKEILNNVNLEIPQSGYSSTDFITLAKKATNLDNKTVGIDSTQGLVEWYPGAANPKLGWYTFADGSFHLDSKEMLEGMTIVKELASNGYAYSQLNKEAQDSLSGENAGLAFEAGQIALYYGSTYSIPAYMEKLNFDWDFIGIPGGRAAIVNDYLGISKNTKYPAEAYEFAKFMSFGKKGFQNRIKLSTEKNLGLTTLPVSTDEQILQQYWELYNVEGVQKIYDNLNNALIDPMKTLPGYIPARWEASIGVKIGENDNPTVLDLIDLCSKGVVQYQDYAMQLNELANKSHRDAKLAITQAFK